MGLAYSDKDGLARRGVVILCGSFDEIVILFSFGLAWLEHSEQLNNQTHSLGSLLQLRFTVV